ncbi:MAG: endonuclease/exonuclease/phosphatase family protein, partial [Candidatus Saccharimonas sp.]
MNQLRVVTWNAEGMFVEGTKTRRGSPHDALETLKKLDADIVVVPEFGRLVDLKDAVQTTIRSLGYDAVTLTYDEPRTAGLGFAILSRLPITQTLTHILPSSKRQLLEVICRTDYDDDIHVFGAHLDDRSEGGRL